jgi:hypothetical protein
MPGDRALCIEKPPGCLGGSERSRELTPLAVTASLAEVVSLIVALQGRLVRFFVVFGAKAPGSARSRPWRPLSDTR